MIVRRLTSDDAADFRALRLRALADHPAAYGSTHADWCDTPVADFAQILDKRDIFGLFPKAGALAGIAAFDRERGGNTRHRAFVTAVYVTPDLRRQDGASLLLDRIAEHARSLGVLQLELHVARNNKAAFECYRRAGYAPFGTSPRAIRCSGKFIDEVLMVRQLDA